MRTTSGRRDVFFYEPIILPEKSSREVQLTLHPMDNGAESRFTVHSRPYGDREPEWALNADGAVITGVDDEPQPEHDDPVDAAIERMERLRPQELFDTFSDMELAWGPNWSGSLKSLWLGEGEAIGDITVGEELAEHLGSEPMHPVLMDLCTGVAFPVTAAMSLRAGTPPFHEYLCLFSCASMTCMSMVYSQIVRAFAVGRRSVSMGVTSRVSPAGR